MAKVVKEKPEVPVVQSEIPNHEQLKAVLNAQPHVLVIHVNDAGEWFFMEKPGFTPYTREDILNG
jgi:hypothetical protein